MTQHLLEEDTLADKQAMQRLASVIGAFLVATILLGLAVGFTMG